MVYLKKYLVYIIVSLGFIAIALIIIFTRKESFYVEFTAKRALRGNPEASVNIVEWSDFECPACGAAFSVIEDVFAKYADKLKFEYRHFPLPYHRHAYLAAVASECANDQGKFWEYYSKLFNNQKNLEGNDLERYAQEINLDSELFNDCLATEVKNKVVDQDLTEANKIGLSFTPSIFINGTLLEDWTQLNQVIESLIKPAESLINPASSSGTLLTE